MRTPFRAVASLAVLALLTAARPASADLTAFLSANTTPQAREGYGFAIGGGFGVVGWEGEYAWATEDPGDLAPALRTLTGNVLFQNPLPMNGFTFYGTLGAGFYREEFFSASETNITTSFGGGFKLTVAGPLRVRVDYRVFTFMGDPEYGVPKRFYVGGTLQF
jgi:hypothetical protein